MSMNIYKSGEFEFIIQQPDTHRQYTIVGQSHQFSDEEKKFFFDNFPPHVWTKIETERN